MSNSFYTFTQEELKTISNRLQAKMQAAGISQRQLANKSKVSRANINDMINGHYSSDGSNEKVFRNHEPETYKKICDGFDILGEVCSMEYLLGEVRQSTHDLQFICDYTGLSEEAVRKLHEQKSDPLNLLQLQVLSTAIAKTDLSARMADYWQLQPASESANITLEYREKNIINHTITTGATESKHTDPSIRINGVDIGLQTVKEVVLKEIQKELELMIKEDQKKPR